MAERKISELESTTDLQDLYTIGTDKNNNSKKVKLQFVKEAADYANAQGDYAKEVADNTAGNTGVNDYPAFSASGIYSAGDVVNYNGKLYRFTAPHQSGAWNGNDVVPTSINAESQRKLTELSAKKVIVFQVASSRGSSLLSMSEGEWGYDMYSDKPTLRTADGIAEAEWDTNTIYRYHNVSFCRKGNEFRLLDKFGTLSAYVTTTPAIADGSLYYDYASHTLRLIAEISVGASFPIQFAEETIFLYQKTLVKIQDNTIVQCLDSEEKIQNIVDILIPNMNLIDLSSINVEDGYFLGAAGEKTPISDKTYKLITYKIEDYRGGIIEVESRVLASNASYALLNSNGDLIAFGANNKPDGHHIITHRFIVPEDAVNLWLCHYGEDGSYSARVADAEAKDESYEAIAAKVTSLESEVNEHSSILNIRSNKIKLDFMVGYRKSEDLSIYVENGLFHTKPIYVNKGSIVSYSTGDSAPTIAMIVITDALSNPIKMISAGQYGQYHFSFVAEYDMYIEVGGYSAYKDTTELIVSSSDMFKDNYVLPEAFGAVGDGITDDTLAFKLAEISGKNILLSSEYVVNDTISLSEGQSLYGVSKATLLSTEEISLIRCTGRNKVSGIKINGNNKALVGILVTGPDCHISSCEIYGCYGNNSTQASGIQGIEADRLLIEGCYIHNIDAVIAGEATSVIGSCQGILLSRCSDSQINNCVVRQIDGREGDGIQIYGRNTDGSYLRCVTHINDCRIINCKYRSIKLQAEGIFVTNTIAETDIDTPTGVVLSFLAPKCEVHQCFFKAENLFSDFQVVEFSEDAKNCVLKNSRIEANGSGAYRCIHCNSSNARIEGNVLVNGVYGIWCPVEADRLEIISNTFYNYKYLGLFLSGTNEYGYSIIKGNVFRTEIYMSGSCSINLSNQKNYNTIIKDNIFCVVNIGNYIRPVSDILFPDADNKAILDCNVFMREDDMRVIGTINNVRIFPSL